MSVKLVNRGESNMEFLKVGRDIEIFFVRCIGFGPIADLIAEYCGKSDRVLLYGELIPDNYYNKEKQLRINTFKIKIDTFDFIETKADSLKNRMKNDIRKETSIYG